MTESVDEVEVSLVIEVLHRRWGVDFRRYARDPIGNQIRRSARDLGFETPLGMLRPLIRSQEIAIELADRLYVCVTEFFRDPEVFDAIRQKILPMLATRPRPRIWHAGCATGEEVYSLSILADEAGLLERTMIYATDISLKALRRGRRGIYAFAEVERAHQRYQRAGGTRSLCSYYLSDVAPGFEISTGSVIMANRLREHINWSAHDLTQAGVFEDIDVVVCRNTLMYFDEALRKDILRRINQVLSPGGFLVLGTSESLGVSGSSPYFEGLEPHLRIYRRTDAWKSS